MPSWLIITIIIIAFAMVVSQLNTVRKNAKHKMRSKSLNELQETLPRSNQQKQGHDSFPHKKP